MRDREMWQQAEAECLRRAGLSASSVSRPSTGNTVTPYPATLLGKVA